MEIISKSLQETRDLAFDLAKKIINREFENSNGALIIGLQGNLGSGKTTFMKSLAEAFGVAQTIQSPTFVIMKFYEIPQSGVSKQLIHIDAYRLDSGSELLKLGWNQIISDQKNIVCVEWPERVTDVLNGYLRISFEHVSENERKIYINYSH